MEHITKNKSGFSLLELLIYISLLSGFLLIIVNIFFMVSSSSQREEARAEVQQNLRFAMEQIASELRSSDSAITVNAPASGASGNILNFTSSGITTEFAVSGGVLRKTIGASINPLTNDKVTVSTSSPLFTRLDNSDANPSIQIILTISYNDNERPNYHFSQTAQTTVSLRQ